jgi:hypothetical protein
MSFRICIALVCLPIYSFSQIKNNNSLFFRTATGNDISVSDGHIFFDHKLIADSVSDILYDSPYNRLIEQNSNVVLFLAIDGSPNYNRLKAFKIIKGKAIELADCVYNDAKQGIGPAPFTDMDKDGKLEFGGFDLTETVTSKDSMCYNPSVYYEIDKGTIKPDVLLTKKMDIKINGIYLKNPLDSNGNHCVIVKKPRHINRTN